MIIKYPSKIGIELVVLFLFVLLPVFYFLITDFKIAGFLVVVFLILFFIYLFTNTYYLINKNSNQLLVKSGILVKITIDIDKIRKIKPSKSLISSPALSLDRIEIFFNTYDSVLISPKNREDFIRQLKHINPTIEFE
ncbi:PH domain-containing protein [Faecalibacter bovis]|uniref:PH domain-containing protein n=1 Tax=Faecalibacter bovis TaxID=2898187 RepID=A0ABX7XFS5_9FLAO|nr:PH domain-containing protein [Faecalibacter bovis]QTV06811.1 PH domain-containing protein [Faecalibacter bovis]